MMFRIVFAYALLRGILDALTGRPDLAERLGRIEMKRSMMRMAQAMRPATEAMNRLGQSFLRTAQEFAIFKYRHPEFWQPAHRIEGKGELG